jgi:hypothetical protein
MPDVRSPEFRAAFVMEKLGTFLNLLNYWVWLLTVLEMAEGEKPRL